MRLAFIQSHIGIARVICGHEPGKPGESAIQRGRAPLGSTGLTGIGSVAERGAAAGATIHHGLHPLAHHGQGRAHILQVALGRGRELVDHIAILIQHLADELKLGQVLTIRDTGHSVRHLQRGGQQSPLADGHVGGITGHEATAVVAVHPLLRGHIAGLIRNGKPGGGAIAEAAGHLAQARRADAGFARGGNLVHEGVVGKHQGGHAVDGAGEFVVVLELMTTDAHAVRAVHIGTLGDDIVAQTGGHGDGLEGGSGGVHTGVGSGDQRCIRVESQRIVILLRNRGDEGIGVEIRGRGQHHHLTGVHINHHEGTAAQRVIAQGLLGSLLPLQIQRGHDGAAGAGLALQLVQNLVATLIEHEAPDAGATRELLVELQLQTGAAFLPLENRVIVVDGAGGQLRLHTGIPQDVTGRGLVRIVADIQRNEVTVLNPAHLGADGLQIAGSNGGAHRQSQPAALLVVIQQLGIRLVINLQTGFFISSNHLARNGKDIFLALVFQLAEIHRRLVGHLRTGHHQTVAV